MTAPTTTTDDALQFLGFTPTESQADLAALWAQMGLQSTATSAARQQWGYSEGTSTGLTYGYRGGVAFNSVGVLVDVPDGTLTLADNSQNFIERTPLGVVSSNTTRFSLDSIPMAVAYVLGGAIRSVTDWREYQPQLGYYPQVEHEVGVVDVRYQIGHTRRYGAKVDNATDDSLAIRNACRSVSALGGGEVTIDRGNYFLANEPDLSGLSNLTINGYGATLRAATRIRSYLYFSGATNIKIYGLTFDQAGPLLPTYTVADYPSVYNAGIYWTLSSDLWVRDCIFLNLYSNGINLYTSGGVFDVRQNKFFSRVQQQNQRLEHVSIQTYGGLCTITDNDFINDPQPTAATGACAVYAAGTEGPMAITNNRMNYCGRDNTGHHRLGVIDFYGDSQEINISGNVATNMLAQFMRVSSVGRGAIYHNRCSTAPNAETSTQMISIESTVIYAALGGQAGTQDIDVYGNTFTEMFDTTRTGVAIGAYDYSVPATDIRVHHNTFVNIKRAVVVGGPWKNIKIHHNNIRGLYGCTINVAQSPGGVPVTALNGVSEVDASYDDLEITDNNFEMINAQSNAVSIDMSKSPPMLSAIGDIDISRNKIKVPGSVKNQAQAILVLLVPGHGQGNVTIRHNRIDNFAIGCYIREVTTVTLEYNRTRRLDSLIVESENGAVNRRGNTVSDDSYMGKAPLLNGGGFYTTREVISDSRFILTCMGINGTQGHVAVTSITPGVGFTVLSSSPTDNCTYAWEVVN